jgi:hypothetical protein
MIDETNENVTLLKELDAAAWRESGVRISDGPLFVMVFAKLNSGDTRFSPVDYLQ